MPKRLFIKTYGCQMNVYDSARMADLLAPIGYQPADAPDDADMVILNTCHIREKAAEKVYSELGRIRLLKEAKAKNGSAMTVAVAGCVAQAEGEEIVRRAPVVDIVVGPQAYHRLPELIAKLSREKGAQLETSFPVEDKFDALPKETGPQGLTAFLTVQEGCDKFCTFCVVPYTRGAEYSRPLAKIVDEAKRLCDAGAREITLLGQNVNAWHGADENGNAIGLAGLIDALSRIENLWRIRYTTSHPRDMDEALIRAHGENGKLAPFLHLPVQSGSDRILDAMNRGHTADEYRRLVDRLRAARPDLALSSDFITGFPGETDADFEATMSLVREIGFAQAFSFKYSKRPGTPAAAAPRQIAEAVKTARLAALQDLLTAQQTAFNESLVGKTLDVLFDRPGRNAGEIAGLSPYLVPVRVKADERLLGRMTGVSITHALPHSLSGVISEATSHDITQSAA
ncbi:MAG TPA: tRNA (N6-isopentenyl adenosine(37)-C2)-methylthiotransferase MiaB [Micropepsaceae bacterium]|nr:tRNA (N6-isopentenyl adenosine(37)-C2)-methylthiotransferase MiaB [Micropepsaceae bacterium]